MTNGSIYVIELYNDQERFFKIGITTGKYSRFRQIMKSGYGCRVVFMARQIEYMKALDLEGELHATFWHHRYQPKVWFGGYNECYLNLDLVLLKSIVAACGCGEVIENVNLGFRG